MKVPASEQKPKQPPLRAAPPMQPQAFRSVIRVIPVALSHWHMLFCVLVAGPETKRSVHRCSRAWLLSAVTIGLGCPRTSLRCSQSEK